MLKRGLRPLLVKAQLLVPFGKRLLISALLVCVFAVLHTIGMFDGIDAHLSDIVARVLHEDEQRIAIVKISKDDYLGLFHGRSPLDASGLKVIISKVISQKPSVIGVDLLTDSDQNYTPLLNLSKSSEIPIIWGSEIEFMKPPTEPIHSIYGGCDFDRNQAVASFVLGEVPRGQILIGIVNFCLVKNRIREFNTVFRLMPVDVPSLSWQVAAKFCEYHSTCPDIRQRLGPNYLLTANIDIPTYTIDQLISGAADLKDKIVLIGGDYGKDEYYLTTSGESSGVKLHACATHALLKKHVVIHSTARNELILEFFLALWAFASVRIAIATMPQRRIYFVIIAIIILVVLTWLVLFLYAHALFAIATPVAAVTLESIWHNVTDRKLRS
jgi:CHASE2 domain-containing sensor protein